MTAGGTETAGQVDATTWLPIREAADLVDVGREALRKRVQRKTVLARKGSDGEWEVAVRWDATGGTPSLVDGAGQGLVDTPGATHAGQGVPLSDPPADRALSRLADVIADQQEREREQADRIAELAATVAMYQERSVNLAAQLDATERRAALAEGRLAPLEAGPIAAPDPTAAATTARDVGQGANTDDSATRWGY